MSSSEKTSYEVQKKKKKNGSIRSIFMHADGVDKWLMSLGLLGAIGDGFTSRLVILLNSRMINNMGRADRAGASDVDARNLHHNMNKNGMLAFVYLALASWVACFLEGYCWTRTAERQAARMRSRYLKAVLRQDVGYFDLHETSTSEVVTSISNDIQIIQDVLSEKVPDFVSKVSTFVAGYMVAFFMVWELAMLGLPFSLLLVVPGLICGRTLTELAKKRREECIKAGTIAEQAISSIRTVYAFVGENNTIQKFSAALHGTIKLGLRQGLVKGLAIGSSGIVFSVWAVMSYSGSRMIIYHGALGGNVFAVGVSIVNGGLVMGSALSNLKYITEACSAGERIMEVTKLVPQIDSDNMRGKILENVSSEVEFKQVKFAYPSRPDSIILNNFCLNIPAGKTIALVGPSGSGKSTVISLLQRFYDPLEGEISLDGIAIDKLQLKWLRSQMASVSQEPSLFSTSIKENILFGKEDGTIEEVIEAAKASNAHNFISQLPQGYDTQVGERGIQVSGGQKQRIAIARALVRKPKILLLDEATSALDSESERLVQEALHKAAMGRTTIVIAHRLSTIRNADVIAVMQNGSVTETGSHDELIQNQNGLYASFVRLQQIPKETSEDQRHCNNSTNSPALPSSASQLNSTPQGAGLDCTAVTAKENPNNMIKPRASFWRLMSMSLPERKQAILGCLSAVLFGAVQPVYGFVMGTTISVFFLANHDEMEEEIRTFALCFFGLSVFSMLMNIIQHYNFAYMGELLSNRIRERLLSKILTFEVEWFEHRQNSSGAICSRLTKEAEMVRSLVGDRMGLLIQTISGVAIAWTMGLIIAWRFAVVIIAAQPILIASLYAKRVLLKTMSTKAIKAQEESCKLAAEAVSNIRTITASSTQNTILKMLEQAQEGPRRESIRQSWVAGIGLGFAQSITTLIWGVSFLWGGMLFNKGHVTARAVFETIIILVATGKTIADAGSMTSDLAMGLYAIGSIYGILDRTTKIEPQVPQDRQVENITGRIQFRDVDFAYPTRPNAMIFQGFSIEMEAGKSTALVGQSGSGKSTIIGLIERFYDPIKGVVEMDGRDLKTYNLKSLRKHMALVSQEPTLFGGTIRENIVYGASDEMDETEIVEAAKAANAHDFISGLKDGYDTSCGDKGVQLSGGQKQRIAIARAILRNPAVLLLDEATSALDSQSEKVMQEALERLRLGRTSVVVAHRLSTVHNCDLIVVIEKGKLVEKGTHSSLLAKGPASAYYSLVNLPGPKTALVD
ncbi:ABC transporter B family member 15-like [Prunus avium]|uniref:ABC transporter B family member 15-like n=1 Tax=Prunus avium TaxID=42229 RepID=A0A6P5T9T7_PRUAV|nr:ABC transporter B family member 15-like [Prunus avium]